MMTPSAPPRLSILRARGGSSEEDREAAIRYLVFSAHAEVVPPTMRACYSPAGILRARGGSSQIERGIKGNLAYSPRTRR